MRKLSPDRIRECSRSHVTFVCAGSFDILEEKEISRVKYEQKSDAGDYKSVDSKNRISRSLSLSVFDFAPKCVIL